MPTSTWHKQTATDVYALVARSWCLCTRCSKSDDDFIGAWGIDNGSQSEALELQLHDVSLEMFPNLSSPPQDLG
jgi:hypothetical protein